jgi:two-component system sensor histidine kinase UhpB
VPLKEILEQLVSERAHQIPEISFRLCTAGLAASYGDSVDLTIYRCIQESLTNAIRHAQPKHVDIEIHDDRVEKVLELIVRDDGRGMSVDASAGLGITGMQERVEGLGGSYQLQSRTGHGTCVNITVPLGNAETAYQSDRGIIVRAT